MPQAPSTRWCPTPEQLMILEEMYRSGIRTPNASQIQQITAHLSYYGKIEGKNVFYWFQNHKARDRQKLRRRLSRHPQLLHLHPAAAAGGTAQCVPAGHQLHGFVEESSTSPLPSPTSLSYQNPSQLFRYQGGIQQDANPAMNLLGKLDANGKEVLDQPAAMGGDNTPYNMHDWMAAPPVMPASIASCSAFQAPPCCKPLKTLDLFPTKSTGALKDECSTSKSSSCSTSPTDGP